jgi:uncharacterized protein (DUF2235 family)
MAGRKLVVCADGTWNRVEKEDADTFVSTNVSKLASALERIDADGNPQILCYLEGVGTHPEERLGGGAFGVGLSANVIRAYDFLVQTYEAGDTLHFFGFSRGAYTVRSLAGLLGNSGLLRRGASASVEDAFALYRERSEKSTQDSVRARVFRQMHAHEVDIEFIGVWDTVGTLGVPFWGYKIWKWLGYAWEFHDMKLGPHIRNAYQALAIHEQRSKFRPALWQKPRDRPNQNLKQLWFCGGHADVGGGYREKGLSDLALKWIIESAQSPEGGGLAFRKEWQSECNWNGDIKAPRHSEFKGAFALLDRLSGRPSGWQRAYASFTDGLETGEDLHPSVEVRYATQLPGDFWPSTFERELVRRQGAAPPKAGP